MDTNSTINRKWKLCAFTSFIGCLILTLSLDNHHNSVRFLAFRSLSITITSSADTKNKSLEPSLFIEKEKPANRIASNCNIFNGKWIYKPVENPLYDEFQCPFLSDQVSCQRNGRPDFGYESWSWEANDCQIPRFDGKDLLERLRGKRMIIVGDSLNRNQWESLACLLYSVVPASRAHVDVQSGVYKVFRAKDYNCSVEFYWSPFLIQLDTNQANGTRVLRLDKIVASAQHWRGADVMVFNTGHWWVHTGKLRAWDLFQYRGNLTREMDIGSAFEIAMKTWAQWIDRNIDSAKTTVFFRSISPEHKGKHWCYNVTQPIMDESYRRSIPMVVIEEVQRTIGGMRTPVRYLNITKLSEYRRDAHPMVYAMTREKVRIEKQWKRPESLADCSHWCLPGLPDTWNRLLYALLVFNTSTDSFSSSHEVV
ncbi:Protein ESKIMO like [Actinidia chinensis var. chinensis]|uniref:Protein ESKIMO like n=1 Tax=Actinidia chinensis var. chinensis TaxID=1590841 RepID=A0A2R6QXG4_ACTCC|nr:Protein ESKIMO like [Actinidia chinensis var. chinensis]